MAIAYEDTASQERVFILPDEVFPSASTMKVCVLMELFHQADLGRVSLDQQVIIKNEFPSHADGNPFPVREEDDGEKDLHARLGETETLLNLARPMITHSSNLATNLLVEVLGAAEITAYMRELGAPSLSVLRGVVDSRAFDLGLNNVVTARGLTAVMGKLYRGEILSPSASKAMIEILREQTYRDCIPAGLPLGTRTANKTGWYDDICHDTAIVYPDGRAPYVLTVLTRGLPTRSDGADLIAEISRAVYRSACG